MDGMSDASGTLQGDVVEKHGSLSVFTPQGYSGAENRVKPSSKLQKQR